jgi:hypothetical protein
MNTAPAKSGQKLSDTVLAIAVKPAGSGSSGLTVAAADSPSCHVSPDLWSELICDHALCTVVCADAAELHWALHQHFKHLYDQEALQRLWDFSRDGRLVDLTLLDQLVRMAIYKGPCLPRKMEDIAKDLAKPHPTPKFTDEVQRLLFVHQHLVAEVARLGNGQTCALLAPSYAGLLGLAIEVQAAIGLHPARQRGLRLAPGMVHDVVGSCQKMRDAALGLLSPTTKRSLGLGDQKPLTKNGFPNTDPHKVRNWLESVHQTQRSIHGVPVAMPLRDNEMSMEPTDWTWQALGNSDLLAWCNMMNACKLRHALLRPTPTILPTYELLPFLRSIGPDLEIASQLTVPPVFVPARDHCFVVVTLPELELRSLAAVLNNNYGQSDLWNVLSAGEPPGHDLASDLNTWDFTDHALRAWLSKPEHSLQFATWLLRVVPRAVGPDWLRTAAQRELNVDMDAAAGETLHNLVLEAFPELRCYLDDETAPRVAFNFDLPVNELNAALRLEVGSWPLSRYLTATRGSPDGQDVFNALRALDKNNIFRPFDVSTPLHHYYADLTGRDHRTPTGRVYQKLTPSEVLGRDHLHVADAIMKSCLWQAAAAGYPVTVATRSEVVLEVLAKFRQDACATLQKALGTAAHELLGEVAPVCIARCQEQWQPAAS